MVEIITLQGDQVVGTVKVHSPIVITVARGRPGGDTIDFGIGDSDSVGSAGSKDNVLTANERSLFTP